MTRSYKMLVLLAMLNREVFPGEVTIADLAANVTDAASRYPRLVAEIGTAEALPQLLERNPIHYWAAGAGTGGVSYFSYEDGVFRTTFTRSDRDAFQELTREIVDWRLAQYLSRAERNAERGILTPREALQRAPDDLPPRARRPSGAALGHNRPHRRGRRARG